MNSLKIYHNTWALQQLPITLKLFSIEWQFLICSDGKTPIDQIQKRLGLTAAERDLIVRRLCDTGLLTETTVSLEDYARSTVDHAKSSTEPQNFQEYVAGLDPAPTTPPPAADSNSHSPAPAPVPAAGSRAKNVPAFSPLQKPSTTSLPMSLQAVIQFILNHHSDPTAGQLATYQVFMGINTALLKRNGITSLRFQDDRIITDPELQAAILESIQKVLKISCTAEMVAPTAEAAK